MNIETKHITDAAEASLVTQINAEHNSATGKAVEALEHARRAGDLLLKAKAELGHGNWLPWVEARCRFSSKTAQRYMRLAADWEQLAVKFDTVSDLTVSGALKLIRQPQKKTQAVDDTYTLPIFGEMRSKAGGCDVPNLAAVLDADDGALWIAPHDNGLLLLTPSSEHPGHAFVDDVNTTHGWTNAATRPMKFGALGAFFPGSVWLRHTECEGSLDLLLTVAPERQRDCAALGLLAASTNAASVTAA